MSKISGKAANEMENYLFMYNDFILESLKFIQKNIDKILMVTVIMFLVMAWTIIFEWEMPKKKNVVFKKTISLEGFKTKDQLLTEELIKDCDDELCKNHNNCLGKESYDCSLDKKCCNLNKENHTLCVGGGKEGPTYDNNLDEWWYLGNKFNKN